MIFLLLPLLLQLRSSLAQTCYWPNGQNASGYKPCPGATAEIPGACCESAEWPHQDQCFTNGYCFSSLDGFVYRGACTDSTWSSSDCAQECLEPYNSGFATLVSCIDQNMCCNGPENVTDCCNSDNSFPWGNNYAQALQNPPESSAAASATSSRASAASSNAVSPAGASTSSQAVAASSDTSCPSSTNGMIGLGVGLGIPLAIALATIAALVVMLRRARESPNVVPSEYNHRSQSQPEYAAVPQEMQAKQLLSELHDQPVPQEVATNTKEQAEP